MKGEKSQNGQKDHKVETDQNKRTRQIGQNDTLELPKKQD